MKPIEFFLAFRFLKEGRSQTLLIFAGAAAGVAVIVFLTSLITGLQQSIIDQTMSLQPHITVEPREEGDAEPLYRAESDEVVFARRQQRPQRVDDIDRWRRLIDDIDADPDVVAVAAVVRGAASVVRGPTTEPIEIRGVDPADYQQIIDIEEDIESGAFSVADTGTVIGVALAEELDVDVGDRIRIVIGEQEPRDLTIQGLFDLGAAPVNESWAFVSIRDAQTMLGVDDSITQIEANTNDLFGADEVADRLQGYTEHEVIAWQETNQSLLRALRTQSASTILISVFVAIAVALGIASVLVVTVVQKRGQVGVLRAIGASMNTILRVFLIQGAAVGLVGSLFGSVLGIGLALGFNSFIRDEAGEVIFPIEPSPTIFAIACLLATITGLLAAVAPARRAAKLDPADAITNA